jgi:FkbM family methyltransferase
MKKMLIGKLFEGAQYLCQMVRVTRDWQVVWRCRFEDFIDAHRILKSGAPFFAFGELRRRGKHLLRPLRLRSGLVLNHGKRDSPLLLLDEVFIKRWYEIGAKPPENANIVDIGANIGCVTMFWANISPSLRFYAYEPNPSAFDTLTRNVNENGLRSRVDIFPEAVGRRRGNLKLWVDVPTALSTGYLETSPSEGGRQINVPVIGLDEVWERFNKAAIWLLKIDTEGAEVDILEGASKSVLTATENAIVEYHDNINPGAYNRCRRLLDAAGFQCQVLVHPENEGIIYARR